MTHTSLNDDELIGFCFYPKNKIDFVKENRITVEFLEDYFLPPPEYRKRKIKKILE